MVDKGKVVGSAAQAKPIIVGPDTVYVHTDIEKIDATHISNQVVNLYQYHEIQYDKDEFIALLANEVEQLKNSVSQLSKLVSASGLS